MQKMNEENEQKENEPSVHCYLSSECKSNNGEENVV